MSAACQLRCRLPLQGWFGRSDSKIHEGEGTIHCIVWGGSVLAWANDVGVRVSCALGRPGQCDSIWQ